MPATWNWSKADCEEITELWIPTGHIQIRFSYTGDVNIMQNGLQDFAAFQESKVSRFTYRGQGHHSALSGMFFSCRLGIEGRVCPHPRSSPRGGRWRTFWREVSPVTAHMRGLLCLFLKVGFFSMVTHDDVIKWKHFPRSWPFVRGIHRSPVNSPHKGQ